MWIANNFILTRVSKTSDRHKPPGSRPDWPMLHYSDTYSHHVGYRSLLQIILIITSKHLQSWAMISYPELREFLGMLAMFVLI